LAVLRNAIDRVFSFACWNMLHFAAIAFLLLENGCATVDWRGTSQQIAVGRELTRQGIAVMESGQWPRAEDLLKQAVEASPDDPDAHRYLAETLWHRRATEEARWHIATAARLDPSDAALAARAGEMALAAGTHDEALARGEQAMRIDPKLAAAWALRGRAFLRLNQPERAAADLERASELSPQSPDVLLDLATIYTQRGQPARALATLHRLLDAYPPGEEPQMALTLEGQALMAMGRPHQAVDRFLAASHRGPPNAELCFLLAQAHASAGHHAAAAAAAQQALAIDTSHAASRQLLAQLTASTPSAEPQRR
jgi:tetratricopeptide (TPR) repeat protein